MTPEHEHAHLAHHTGHRWLDLTLGLCAMFVSVLSLVVAVRHGISMDRLVAANSWPFLKYTTNNQDSAGKPVITLRIDNVGVGPALLNTFEVWWQGQPVANADDLLSRCCMPERKGPQEVPDIKALGMSVGVVAPNVMRAGDEQDVIRLERTEANGDVWDRLDRARLNLTLRACYCSVFDECWVTNLQDTSSREVDACPAAKEPFVLPERWYRAPPAPPAPAPK